MQALRGCLPHAPRLLAPGPSRRPLGARSSSVFLTQILKTRVVASPLMASLSASLKDLASPSGRLRAAQGLTDAVYGPWDPVQSGAWRPRAYADNKSRYLWTDAFGVCNFVTLACETGQLHYLDQADALIRDVHETLGRDRAGRARLGAATEGSPTLGGLRIGKEHPEGHHDGDGQYFHYITKWAFALNRMGLARGDPKYNRWAVELMGAVHPWFVVRPPPGAARPCALHWKISCDMRRPVVRSEGNLDPYDGLVTVRLLRAAAPDPGAVLAQEEEDFAGMVEGKYRRYYSNDPLDLGEALWLGHWGGSGEGWAQALSQRSALALEEMWQDGYFRVPPAYRLAFRELGTTLGAQVNPAAQPEWGPRVQELHRFWAPRVMARDADISPVMMASSLVPGVWGREYEGKLRVTFS